MIEKIINISVLKKIENESCNGFLHYFVSPENFTGATLQPVHDSVSHIEYTFRAKEVKVVSQIDFMKIVQASKSLKFEVTNQP